MSLILVTGGAGFIGSHVVPMLIAEGHRVRVLDSLTAQVHGPVPSSSGLRFLTGDDVEFIRGSVTDARDLRKALNAVDVVIHLAAETGTAQSMYEIARYNEVNVAGTALLLDLLANDANRSVRRMVLASSRSVYGEGAYACAICGPEQRLYPGPRQAARLAAGCWEHQCEKCGRPLDALATRETDQIKPASIYAATKFAQEQLVSIACNALGMEHLILRLQNVYGEGQSLNNPYTGILSIFSTRIRQGEMLPIFEDGEETRDFVHVEDVARALTLAATLVDPPHCLTNVGSGIRTSIVEVAGILSDVMERPRNIRVTGQYRLGDIRHNFADTQRLDALLGKTFRVGLEDGLRRFSSWVATQALPEDGLDRANAELQNRNLMGKDGTA